MIAQPMMLARTLFEPEVAPTIEPFSLRLVQFDRSDVRITNPHVSETAEKSAESLSGLYESMREEHRDPVPVLSASELQIARFEMPIHQIYFAHLHDWRKQQRDAGKIRSGTLQKERQTMRCFAAWDTDAERAPADWPRGIAWKGLPAGYVATQYVERWIRARLHGGKAVGTMESRWCHFRTILNMVRALGVIDDVPKVDASSVIESYLATNGDPDNDLVPTTYTLDQLEAIYRLLHEPDMRAAWVLGTNCGPRSVDLFSLRWGINVRLGEKPELFYRAVKTGKRHWVPLHPVTVSHLRRLVALQGHLLPDSPQGMVFPRLTSAKAKDPEKGRPARRRNDRIKQVMAACGIPTDGDYETPWQVLRSTCNSRLNNHRPGSGRLVTHGKDADVSSTNYWDHHPTLVEAISTLQMPAAFSDL